MAAGRNDLHLLSAVRVTKTVVTRKTGHSVWQRSFYEHIIRSEQEGVRYLKYMDENPIRWTLDQYFAE